MERDRRRDIGGNVTGWVGAALCSDGCLDRPADRRVRVDVGGRVDDDISTAVSEDGVAAAVAALRVGGGCPAHRKDGGDDQGDGGCTPCCALDGDHGVSSSV